MNKRGDEKQYIKIKKKGEIERRRRTLSNHQSLWRQENIKLENLKHTDKKFEEKMNSYRIQNSICE